MQGSDYASVWWEETCSIQTQSQQQQNNYKKFMTIAPRFLLTLTKYLPTAIRR